ncbi:MAG: murein DD-endopeptidase MepM/ murein hydrolase activator NlpD [Phenylobacterium sp.]|jgi:murein DD-endopeptidase MepM/ murein hydrolase activator NlpD
MNKLVLPLNLIMGLVMSFTVSAHQPAKGVVLKGQLTQGSMVIGKTHQGAKVLLNQKPLKVSANGDFVFGFGRDDKLQHELKVISQSGEVEIKPLTLSKRKYKVEDIKGIDKKYVSPPKDVLARIIANGKQVAKARAVDTERLDFLSDIKQPVQGRISGVYGSQRVLNGVPKRPHFGLDIAAPTGTKVLAPLQGIVVLTHDDMYYTGGTLIIEHGFGITSTFIHLSKILVKEGDVIKQGDVIAQVGATGRVTGPHLDWRMNWYKVRLDPQLLLETE